jgi:hypothetical protein
MFSRLIAASLFVFAAANLVQAGSLKSKHNFAANVSIGSSEGCSTLVCVAGDAAGGVYELGKKSVQTSFSGASQISLELPNQFSSLVRHGSLTTGGPATVLAGVSGAQPGAPDDDPVYYLANGNVLQRDLPNLTVGNTDATNSSPAMFNLYATSVVMNTPSPEKGSSGSLATLDSDPSTGGATSNGRHPVLPVVGSAPTVPTSNGHDTPSNLPNGSEDNVSYGNGVDSASNCKVSPVPEPSTELMLGIGFVAIGVASRFTRRRNEK